jgi:predicted enzyme related to lactoylglutathione lyase
MSKIEGMITFTYHEDVETAFRFYRDVLELTPVMDRDWVKILKVGNDCHIGLVNSEKGYLKPMEDKPVMLTIMVEDAERWYQKLSERGAKTNHPPKTSEDIHMRGFLTWDPSGYVIEMLEFLTKPYGE